MEDNVSQVAEETTAVESVETTTQEEISLPVAEEQPKPAGTLFESIAYRSPEDIPRFIEAMSINDAAMVLLTIVGFAHKKGIFNLLESEVASKAVRVFTTPRQPVNPPEEKIEQPKQ
jgi:hypothetical protein